MQTEYGLVVCSSILTVRTIVIPVGIFFSLRGLWRDGGKNRFSSFCLASQHCSPTSQSLSERLGAQDVLVLLDNLPTPLTPMQCLLLAPDIGNFFPMLVHFLFSSSRLRHLGACTKPFSALFLGLGRKRPHAPDSAATNGGVEGLGIILSKNFKDYQQGTCS